jgi:hypothetical protein
MSFMYISDLLKPTVTILAWTKSALLGGEKRKLLNSFIRHSTRIVCLFYIGGNEEANNIQHLEHKTKKDERKTRPI